MLVRRGFDEFAPWTVIFLRRTEFVPFRLRMDGIVVVIVASLVNFVICIISGQVILEVFEGNGGRNS